MEWVKILETNRDRKKVLEKIWESAKLLCDIWEELSIWENGAFLLKFKVWYLLHDVRNGMEKKNEIS